MKIRKVNILCTLIAAILIACFAPKALATEGTVNIVASKDTISLGEEVTVNITLTGVTDPGLYSYQLKLIYNSTLLNATSAVIPSDHMLKPSLSPSNIFIVDPGTINQTDGYVTFAASLLGTEPGKLGAGTLVTVTFVGLAMGTSNLTLPEADLIVVDASPNPFTPVIGSESVTIVPEFAVVALMAIFAALSGAAVAFRKKLK